MELIKNSNNSEVKYKLLDFYSEFFNRLTELESSDQVYEIVSYKKSGANMKKSDNGTYVYVVSLENIEGPHMFIHEMTHAYQYEIGEISFAPDGYNIGKLTDIFDEVEAYNAQLIAERGIMHFQNPSFVEGGLPSMVDEEDVYRFGAMQNPPLYNEFPNKKHNLKNTKCDGDIYRKRLR